MVADAVGLAAAAVAVAAAPAAEASDGAWRLTYRRSWVGERQHLDVAPGEQSLFPHVRAAWLALELASINNRSIELYDFTGTGADPASDADAGFYEIDSGGLSLQGINAADPVVVAGFPTPFASAPPDFTAQTVAK